MLLALVPSLAAAPLTCDGTVPLDELVDQARQGSGAQEIEIYDGCETDGIEYLDFGSGEGDVTDFTLSADPAIGAIIPPVRVSDGNSLTLDGVNIVRSSAVIELDSALEVLLGSVFPGVEVAAEDATLALYDVTLTGDGGAGIVALDTDIHVETLTASDFDRLRAMYVIASNTPVTAAMTSLTIEGSEAGGLVAVGDGDTLTASINSGWFEENGPAAGADLYLDNVTAFQVDTGTFLGSDGGANAPVDVTGGPLDCNYCYFTGTSGDGASTISAVLGDSDELTIENSTLEPASTDPSVVEVDSGGSVTVSNSDFWGAGTFLRYVGSTHFYATRFHGSTGQPDREVIKVVGSSVFLDGVTLCDYSSTGFGIIGAYGSYISLTDSVLQNLALDGDAVIHARSTEGAVNLTVEDNTFVDSAGVLVNGSPNYLVYVNNLHSGVLGGLDLDSTPGTYEVHNNLWYETDTPIAGGEPDATDVVDEDPKFDKSYSSRSCGSSPALQAGSPADGAGTADWNDGYGNNPSDIGAVDYDGGSVPVDDTGEVSSDDTAIASDDTAAAPDSAPPDIPTVIGGALPPCGCGDSRAAFLLLLAPLIRRRRA
jgi:hypothetical protein